MNAVINILLIEDNTGDARLVLKMLKEAGDITCRITYVTRLDQVIGQLKEGGFDLILLDLGIADSNGLATFRKISSHARSLPIIILTGMEYETLALNAIQEGAQDYLPKNDVDSNLLVRSIRYAMERKHAENNLALLNTELTRKNRELEQIVYVTSHDLRSPLVNIQGFGKELSDSISDLSSICENENDFMKAKEKMALILRQDIPESLKYIQKSAEKMDMLISGLLRLSRLGRTSLTIEPCDMNAIMANILSTVEFQIKSSGAIVDLDPLPPCIGDCGQINQVFSNLLDNALKYLDPNRLGRISISGKAAGDNVAYCVADNGVGIAGEHAENVFEIFHRLSPEEIPGEGLGLNIVNRILGRLNGRVWMESEFGEGSRFYVSLPGIATS